MNSIIIILVIGFIILIYVLAAIKIYKNANNVINPLWLILIILIPILGPLIFLSYRLPRKKKQ